MKDVFVLFIMTVIHPMMNYSSKSRQFCVMSIHRKNLQILATEMFRVQTGSASDILNEVFPLKPLPDYNLGNKKELTILAYLGSKIWELLPNKLKGLELVEAFKGPH